MAQWLEIQSLAYKPKGWCEGTQLFSFFVLSQLGEANQKEGIQYTNEAFQNNDDDRSSTGSGGPEGKGVLTSWDPPKPVENTHSEGVSQSSSARQRTQFSDNASDSGSDRADNEKEVKPILTKERRVEEGYKSVWFKEDIDPNAKEEVVIIPENRDEHSDDEDEEPSSDSRGDKDENLQRKSPKVLFAETDLDSGLGVKFDDPADDSENDDELNFDLWERLKHELITGTSHIKNVHRLVIHVTVNLISL